MLDRLQLALNRLTAGAVPPPRCHLPPSEPAGPGSGYRVLLVHAHPCSDSYSAALAAAAEDGLKAAGHSVARFALYDWLGTGRTFAPALTRAERDAYHAFPDPSDDVRPFVAELRRADALVFVYPTWWFSVPAPLKGLIDRAYLPGVAFAYPGAPLPPPPPGAAPAPAQPSSTGLVPLLTNVKKVGVVTTYGAPRHIAAGAVDAGNLLLGHALLPLYHAGCSVRWLGLYGMNSASADERAAFLLRVRSEFEHGFLPSGPPAA